MDDIRHLMEAFQKRDINPALHWLRQNASRDEQLIYDLQKQHFIKLLEDGTMHLLLLKWGRINSIGEATYIFRRDYGGFAI